MKEPTLKTLREQNNKTCAEVAQALNVTVRAIFNYEYGLRQINIRQVLILAKIYETSAEDIILAQLNSLKAQEDNQR